MRRLQRIAADLGQQDHRLGAAVDAELLQDGGDMRLDGRLGDAEFDRRSAC